MSDSHTPNRLCVIIIDNPELTDELITGFLEIGVGGATIVETRGMGQIIRHDMPIFAGLASLFPEATGSRMIFSAMPEALVESVLQLVEDLVGTADRSGSAICFTLPLDEFRSFRK